MPAAKSRSWHLGRVQIIFFILSSVCSQLVCGYWSGSLFPLDRLVDSAARNAAPKSEPPITALNHVASDLLAMPLNRIERFLGKPNGFAVQQPGQAKRPPRSDCNGWLDSSNLPLPLRKRSWSCSTLQILNSSWIQLLQQIEEFCFAHSTLLQLQDIPFGIRNNCSWRNANTILTQYSGSI